MPQHEIEVILMRELASYLAMPIFVVDPDGNLLFYNEPAEHILGMRFDETGPMAMGEWATAWHPTTPAGEPIAEDDLPLVIAIKESRPATSVMAIIGSDGVRRSITVAALPLIGQGGRRLGAAAIFWEDA